MTLALIYFNVELILAREQSEGGDGFRGKGLGNQKRLRDRFSESQNPAQNKRTRKTAPAPVPTTIPEAAQAPIIDPQRLKSTVIAAMFNGGVPSAETAKACASAFELLAGGFAALANIPPLADVIPAQELLTVSSTLHTIMQTTADANEALVVLLPEFKALHS